MPHRKIVRWSSPANAWAIGAQLISLCIPVLSVLEIYQPVALEAISVMLADTWQWVLLLMAALALFAATVLTRAALGHGGRLQSVFRVEAVATGIVAICYLLLWWALVQEYGFNANPLTQLLVGGLGLAAVGRVAQIITDLVKYRRALRGGHLARVEAVAQSKET